MKKILLSLSLVLLPLMIWAQKIEKERDDLSGKKVFSTSWEDLEMVTKSRQYFKFRRLGNNDVVLRFKVIITPKTAPIPFDVKKGSELWIKLANGEVIKLQSTDNTKSTVGGGAVGLTGSESQGADIRYEGVTDEVLDKFIDTEITKMRIYTSQGHFDAKVLPEGATKFKLAAKLISKTSAQAADEGDF